MQNNYMDKIIEMLGVKYNELFSIDSDIEHKYYIDTKGCWQIEKDSTKKIFSPETLTALLNGNNSIIYRKHTGLENISDEDDIIYLLNGNSVNNLYKTEHELKYNEFTSSLIRNHWLMYIKIKKQLAKVASELNEEPINFDDNGVAKYYMYCNFVNREYCINIDVTYTMMLDTIYFSSREAAEKAIKIVGEDNLIYLLSQFTPYKNYSDKPFKQPIMLI